MKPIIGTYEEAQNYLQDNEFIKSGYRINYNSIRLGLKSLFQFHNEFVNIWSHLLGALLFWCLFFYLFVFSGIDGNVEATSVYKNLELNNASVQSNLWNKINEQNINLKSIFSQFTNVTFNFNVKDLFPSEIISQNLIEKKQIEKINDFVFDKFREMSELLIGKEMVNQFYYDV